jgi:predicted outer membrane repeat protein
VRVASFFRDNLNSGLLTHESEDMLIADSIFRDNNSTAHYSNTGTLDPGPKGFRLAGGLVISWNSTNDGSTTVIRNCTFISNHAGINQNNSDDTRPNIYRPRGHGGAMVVSFERTQNHTLVIEKSRFINNTALFNGGGVFISIYRDSVDNDIIITDSAFEDNSCVHTGGAISMNTFEVANNNILAVENTSFDRNSAWVGGGAYSLTLQVRGNLAT